MWFLHVEWQTRRYPIPVQNPTGTSMNFYPRVWVQVRISTRNLFTNG
jgi:hypothetical protein